MTVWTGAARLAQVFHVPVGTIHRWANEDRWPRVGRGKTIRYKHEAAEETYAKRRVASV